MPEHVSSRCARKDSVRKCRDCKTRYAQELGLCRQCQEKRLGRPTRKAANRERLRNQNTVLFQPAKDHHAPTTSWWVNTTREEFRQAVEEQAPRIRTSGMALRALYEGHHR